MQTRSICEWSTTPSQLRMSLIYYLPGGGLLELFWGKIVPTRSVSGGCEDDVDEGYASSAPSIPVIHLHLTCINPRHIHRSGRKGPQRNQSCIGERTLFTVLVSRLRMTPRNLCAVENRPQSSDRTFDINSNRALEVGSLL